MAHTSSDGDLACLNHGLNRVGCPQGRSLGSLIATSRHTSHNVVEMLSKGQLLTRCPLRLLLPLKPCVPENLPLDHRPLTEEQGERSRKWNHRTTSCLCISGVHRCKPGKLLGECTQRPACGLWGLHGIEHLTIDFAIRSFKVLVLAGLRAGFAQPCGERISGSVSSWASSYKPRHLVKSMPASSMLIRSRKDLNFQKRWSVGQISDSEHLQANSARGRSSSSVMRLMRLASRPIGSMSF